MKKSLRHKCRLEKLDRKQHVVKKSLIYFKQWKPFQKWKLNILDLNSEIESLFDSEETWKNI